MYSVGLDIGSTTSKAVVINEERQAVVRAIVRSGIGTAGGRLVYEKVLTEITGLKAVPRCITVTGYGREGFEQADYRISELTAHAKGVFHTFPEVRTVIDIGGQDAKVIRLGSSGQMTNFLMNDKCAAGTGRFLDVMAGILQIDVSQIETEAAKSEHPVQISNTCTVFAESEVISQLAAGKAVCDVVAGICDSAASKVAALARRTGVEEKVCLSGGVAKNGGVRGALEKALGASICYSADAQYMGALGAALYGIEKRRKHDE